MLNTLWSEHIQSSHELYVSRSLRFREDNADIWLPFLHIGERAKILELGCAGGALLHRVKQLVPGVNAVGLDRDDGHIEYAMAKSAELGLECEFIAGDALSLPFADGSFDVTFSHTVTGHVPMQAFLSEQLRVLKPGGRAVVWSVRTKLNLNTGDREPVSGNEKRLFDKLWDAVNDGVEKELHVGEYELSERGYATELEAAGFSEVELQFFTIIPYAPDNAGTPAELAEAQINEGRLAALSSVSKAARRAPGALSPAELAELELLINERYDARLTQYRRGEKLWDIATSTVLSATGGKR
ncbi:MAG: methyltransferase domain-containing protein [Oscillospiraceae bacterium]|jgi:ubiquinone/menaquinone biosynthesis C-methylase UbiE|nr:methyltransferase domain-containing protein [Oscillospiraceae bacterium]